MRFLAKLLGTLAVFTLGVILGFMVAPAKQGIGTTVNYNFNDVPPSDENEAEDEALGI